MLKHLSIKDFAVVRQTELEFGPGMTVVSGETGAGKSLMVDALTLLSGARADSGMVRHGSDRAELAAEFSLDAHSPALHWLRENELDEDGASCQLRRIIRADGGSKAWINGRAATISQLAELAAFLVEVHGQHDQQALMARSSQLSLLDAYARNGAQRTAVRAAASHWQALLDEASALSERGDVGDRIDWLTHQLTELDQEDLSASAIAQLTSSHRRQAHATALGNACEHAHALIGGDEEVSALDLLRQARSELARLVEHEPRLAEVDALLDSAAIALDEAMSLVDRIGEDLDGDPESFVEIEARLGRLHALARKHRVPMEELAGQQARLREEVEQLRGTDERLQALAVEIGKARTRWQADAAELSQTRQQAGQNLSQATSSLINELGMGGSVFCVQLEPHNNERPDPLGAERVEFLVAANAGQPPRPLRKVASGGELSRISLAIEVATIGLDSVQTMVFDEVDSGISGAVADIVGSRLRALGEHCQVLCVTHLPQVAAKGHTHYRVSKAPVEGMTQSAVERLDRKAREEEIARMLGGVEISSEARAAARKLIAV
ncbi:DNA recombination protein RecN [Stenotrophomonas ginsengisoli]|uniref:DNA repair protein RecN n=1 Tax=Stenotrophomonas ginsengisoli TaxID=336566 RepID=A0A0R0DEL8_9GAMM|nr:DNA repair protein RecN [Stenotrophomonas ginsengisoli]KRG76164.1 DNA recombination protein RecN [Stenotrophomonas ginsengisoli]